MKKTKWIIWVACATHLFWGVILVGWGNVPAPGPSQVNAINHIAKFFGDSPTITGFVLIVAALLAVHSLLCRKGKYDLLFAIPQQMIMIFSALAAVQSTMGQQFADGAAYPWYFIGPDQCWHIFNGIGHTLALWQIHSWVGIKKWISLRG
jgi:hypothetical protein